jgi:hypothetical protein
MKLVVIGGHSRNIGKTSLACNVIRATRDLNWTGVKISQFGHGVCSSSGKECNCAVEDPDHPFAVGEERGRDQTRDSARMLTAGAARAFWARAPQGRLAMALPALEEVFAEGEHVIVESNTLLDLVKPSMYVAVLDFAVEDFKDSARRHLPLADAFAVVERNGAEPWEWFDRGLLDDRPVFRIARPEFSNDQLGEFVRERLSV